MDTSNDTIDLKLGRDEALVLFEMLFNFYDQPALRIERPADRLALVRLQGGLESVLVEPLMPNYRNLIEDARSRLEAQFGG